MSMTPKQNIQNMLDLQAARVDFLLKCGHSPYEASQDEVINYFSERVIEIDAAIPVGILNPNV